MAFGVVHFFPGATKENYEARSPQCTRVTARCRPADLHAAGASPGGWTIMAVHDSKASWESFRDGTLMPKMQAGIEGGFRRRPRRPRSRSPTFSRSDG